MVSPSRIRPVEIVRGIYLGIAFILSIPTLVFLAEFAHNHSLQGRALVFKNLGFVVGPLSLAVLPAMSNLSQSLLAISGLIHYFIRRIIHWRVVEKSLSVVSEISIIVVLWSLWMAFLILGMLLQDQLYPVPGYVQRQKSTNGCQFLPPGPEVHRCQLLILSSNIPIGIVSILFDHIIMVLICSIIFHRKGNPIWTQPAKDAFSSSEWNCQWPGAKRSSPSSERP